MRNMRVWRNKIKSFFMKTLYEIHHPKVKGILRFVALLCFATWSLHALADPSPGTDLLAGTDSGVEATLQGTGKKYIYIIEGVVAVAAYIKSKNILAFLGVLVISVFLNILLHFIGS
jgi:hypothetical protein